MRVLAVHNYYQEAGGEDEVFAAEAALLKRKGHTVTTYTIHNSCITPSNLIQVGCKTFWNRTEFRKITEMSLASGAELIHFHNTFPLLSPSAYYAASRLAIPCVQTLHNYRLICPNAILYREGHVCEECVGKTVPWPGAVHACYRDSRLTSALTAGMLSVHRSIGTWRNKVTIYIALTEFAKQKCIEGGLPADRIAVKPNFLNDDPGPGRGGDGALFVGRLAESKGVRVLLDAWKRLAGIVPLTIIGDGPLAPEVRQATVQIPGVRWLGRQPKDAVFAEMRAHSLLVVPSGWYEAFPMTVVEAFATGLPVVASNLGSLATLVDDGRTGLHFAAGNAADLAAKVRWALSNSSDLARMRLRARSEFEVNYTAEMNYAMLMGIYTKALTALERLAGDNGRRSRAETAPGLLSWHFRKARARASAK